MRQHLPWFTLPAHLADILSPTVPQTVTDTVHAISREVPAYQGALDDEIGPTVRRGVEIALARMLALFGTDDPALDERARAFYRGIGAGENEQGRSLEALLAAYRTGARVAWERMSAAATEARVDTADLVALAESIFVYIDELSGASALGHADAEAVRSGYRQVQRSQLAEALVDGLAATSPAKLSALAESSGWALPTTVAVAVVPKSVGTTGPPLPMAPPDVLVLERDADAVAVIPDPAGPGRRARLSAGVAGPVFVGTVRSPSQAPLSFDHAVRLRELASRGLVPDDRIILATEYLPELLVSADAVLAAQLAERSVRPLAAVAPAKRQTLLVTLAAWLDQQGDRAAVARQLVVHPQTVSYRLGRLREFYGDSLESSAGRFALRLGLAAEGFTPDRTDPG